MSQNLVCVDVFLSDVDCTFCFEIDCGSLEEIDSRESERHEIIELQYSEGTFETSLNFVLFKVSNTDQEYYGGSQSYRIGLKSVLSQNCGFFSGTR